MQSFPRTAINYPSYVSKHGFHDDSAGWASTAEKLHAPVAFGDEGVENLPGSGGGERVC